MTKSKRAGKISSISSATRAARRGRGVLDAVAARGAGVDARVVGGLPA
jgi:hypothetical protein